MRKLILSLIVAASSTVYAAQSTNCTVTFTSLPTMPLTAPGVYCLGASLSFSGSGAAITLNNTGAPYGATFDFNGYSLNYTGTDPNSKGVYATGGGNYVIQNGLVTGFGYGIYSDSANVTIQDIKAVANVTFGIFNSGGKSLVEHNFVQNSASGTANGISVSGGDARIVNNYVSLNSLNCNGCSGITAASSGTTVIEGNSVSLQTSFGILMSGAGNFLVKHNQVSGATYGFYQNNSGSVSAIEDNAMSSCSHGIYVNAAIVGAAKYRNNLTTNVATPYSGGLNVARNDS